MGGGAMWGHVGRWDNRPMHPKALLDACAELVRLTLSFQHPADAVVSRYFRDHRNLGPRERGTLAETVYTVLRKKRLFDQLAHSGSSPRERRLAILGFYGPRDFLKSALNDQERAEAVQYPVEPGDQQRAGQDHDRAQDDRAEHAVDQYPPLPPS